ncbi:uncharacterized protein LOC130012285 [Patella vulgata]|uniref:uncharacterized protein LOC130012285 n=1 Tax=Patella vulgata TaxID=6465 RepID=UPI0024A9836F|nr:uncharacterized protein LOC130012285 [Patella vulgata]
MNNGSAASPSPSSSNGSNIHSKMYDALFNQGDKIDKILKHVSRVPIWHSYTFKNGTTITWITIESRSAVDNSITKQTTSSSNTVLETTNKNSPPLKSKARLASQTSAQTTDPKRVNEPGTPSNMENSNGDPLVSEIGTKEEISPNFDVMPASTLQKPQNSVINGVQYHLSNNKHSPTNTNGIENLSPIKDQPPVGRTEVYFPSEIAIPTDVTAKNKLDSPLLEQQFSSYSGITPSTMGIVNNVQGIGVTQDSYTQNENPKTIIQYHPKNQDVGAIPVVNTGISDSEDQKQELNIPIITTMPTVNNINPNSTVPKTPMKMKRPVSAEIFDTGPASKLQPELTTIPQKDYTSRHTAGDISYVESPLNINLRKAASVDDNSKAVPNGSADLAEIKAILKMYDIRSSQELQNLLHNRNSQENKEKFNSIKDYFTGPKTNCPVDKPCLWCRSSPAWSFVDGITGWCMRNCKTSRCEHNQCKCACVDADEFSRRLIAIASSDLRG